MIPTALTPRFERLGRDSAYLLVSFPVWITAFVAAVTGLSAGGGLLIVGIGVPVIIATLLAARLFASLERTMQRSILLRPTPPARYEPINEGTPMRRLLAPAKDPQSWLDVVGSVILFPVSTATWSIAVTWWATAIGSLSFPLWGWALRSVDNQSLFEVMGLPRNYAIDVVGYLLLGVIALVTLPWAMRGLTVMQSGLARLLFIERSERQSTVETLVESRAAGRQAEAGALQRLERDIHDGPQQRLVRLSMDLGRAKRQIEGDNPQLVETLDSALQQTKDTLDELRALSRGIAPPVLTDRGLRAAIEELAARSSVPVDLQLYLPTERLLPHVESTVYFVVSEALTNVAKHSGASAVNVWVAYRGHDVGIRVSDNGGGGAMLAKGHGLVGLSDRVRAADGIMNLSSPLGGPTVMDVEVPCAW